MGGSPTPHPQSTLLGPFQDQGLNLSQLLRSRHSSGRGGWSLALKKGRDSPQSVEENASPRVPWQVEPGIPRTRSTDPRLQGERAGAQVERDFHHGGPPWQGRKNQPGAALFVQAESQVTAEE